MANERTFFADGEAESEFICEDEVKAELKFKAAGVWEPGAFAHSGSEIEDGAAAQGDNEGIRHGNETSEDQGNSADVAIPLTFFVNFIIEILL